MEGDCLKSSGRKTVLFTPSGAVLGGRERGSGVISLGL